MVKVKQMTLSKVLFACVMAGFLTGPALAQISSEGGPIYVNSDRTESLERERKVLLIGNVDIQQGDARLRADRVTILFAGTSNQDSGALGSSFGQIESMLAEGDVYYVTPELKATGKQGVYNATSDTITMTGDVALMRGGDVAEGETLTLEIGERRTTLDGGNAPARMLIDPENQPGNN